MITLILIAIYAMVKVVIDSKHIKDGHSPVHWFNALMISIMAGYFSVRDELRPIYFSFPVLLYTYSYLFDGLLNLELKRKIFAIGQTAVTDKIERWILGNDESKFGMWFIMKSILFIGLVGCYLFNY